jgi:hypothetical protein
LDQIKEILGPSEFLNFIEAYVKAPDHCQKIKDEMYKLEKEVHNIEAKEVDKLINSGLPPEKESFQSKLYSYSSLCRDL